MLTTTEEHPGIRSPLDVIARRAGVRVVELPPERLLDGIGDDTRMVAVSHVLWTTGRVLDVAAISAAAHEAGASLLLDGAQSAGAIAVDAAATGADFYAFSGQKWLLGPQGSGGLWVSPEWLDRRGRPSRATGTWSREMVGDFLATAARFDGGTLDTVTVAGIGAAIEWVESLPGGRAGWLAADRGQRRAAPASGCAAGRASPWPTTATTARR